MDEDDNDTFDHGESIKQLHPIQLPELTVADAGAQASKIVADMFVSLRGASAYALITHVSLMVRFFFSLQRVQEPTNRQVRLLNATTMKLQACPKKIVYQAMTLTGEVGDLHSDSGHRRLSGGADDEVNGYGIRGANLLRRGSAPSGQPVVHLIDACCKSHRLQVRSSYRDTSGCAQLGGLLAHGCDPARAPRRAANSHSVERHT
eukprot:4885480-Pyramimonas_sp.AAC.1